MVTRSARPVEQQLFARLAVFAGGCTLDAVEEVCHADLDTLQSLVDKSLLRHTGERFWMLETIREYAVERLEHLPEANRTHERHADWYTRFASEGHARLRGPAQEEWLLRFDADAENLRSAIGWACDHDERLEVQLAGATWFFLSVRGFLREALGHLLHALEVAEGAPPLDQSELPMEQRTWQADSATTPLRSGGANNASSSAAPAETVP